MWANPRDIWGNKCSLNNNLHNTAQYSKNWLNPKKSVKYHMNITCTILHTYNAIQICVPYSWYISQLRLHREISCTVHKYEWHSTHRNFKYFRLPFWILETVSVLLTGLCPLRFKSCRLDGLDRLDPEAVFFLAHDDTSGSTNNIKLWILPVPRRDKNMFWRAMMEFLVGRDIMFRGI